MQTFYFQAMNAVIKTWRDGPYIFIVQIGVTALKDSANKVKRMEKTTPASNPKEKLFTSKTAKNRYCFFYVYRSDWFSAAFDFT